MFRGHNLVVGATHSGKTYFAEKLGLKSPAPVVFVNPQVNKLEGYTRFDGKQPVEQLKRYLQKKGKVDYIPSVADKTSKYEIYGLMVLLKSLNVWCELIIDEADVWSPQGVKNSPITELAQRGRHYKLNCTFITQSAGLIHHIIPRMCDNKYLFKFDEYEEKYLNTKGYPAHEFREKIKKAGDYAHIKLVGGEIEGVYDKKRNKVRSD